MNRIFDVIKPQSELERRILEDPELQKGLLWGKPRDGHPEGEVLMHVQHVLANVEELYGNDADYAKLRIITIIHDSFKYKVDETKPKKGENHHSRIACRFAEKHCTEADLLRVIETHDDAYLAYRKGKRDNNWKRAEERIQELLLLIQEADIVELYRKFFHCDNRVNGKTPDSYEWFLGKLSTIESIN